MGFCRLKTSMPVWQTRSLRFVPYVIGIVILGLLPAFMPIYIQTVLTKAVIFAIFAMSLDILFGYTGLFSLGHAAFFGAGGYTAGILMVRYGVDSFWLGAPSGVLVAALLAAIFGAIVIRVSGVYFLLVTFALGQLMVAIATKSEFLSTTTSTEGVIGILRPDIGFPFTWNNASFYYFVLVVFLLCFYIMHRLVNSPFGLSLRGIRDSVSRMRTLGYNVTLHKYIAFIVSGAFAGCAGVLIAYHNGFMAPSSFGITTSALVMLMVIIGGAGTLYGPIIGAVVVVFIEFIASTYTQERWPLILGSFFVIAVMYARGGIIVRLSQFWRKVTLIWKH